MIRIVFKRLVACIITHVVISMLDDAVEAVSSRGFCYTEFTRDDLARKLWGTSNYTKSKWTRPNLAKLIEKNPRAKPTLAEDDIVKIGINLVAVKNVDDKKNEIVIELIVNQYWNDYRLQYETAANCTSPEEYFQKFEMIDFPSIWKPEIHVKNLVEKPIDLKGEFYVYPNGNVKFRQASLFTLSCKLDLLFHPYDTQRCPIVIALASETSNISYIYNEIPITNQVSDFIADTVEWTLKDYGPKSNNYNPGPQSSLNFSVDVKRFDGYYDTFVIVPVFLMVTIGWTSFFVSRAAVPARITMTKFAFLTIINYLGQQLSSLPRIGSKRAHLLQFILISLFFSFFSIVQYVFVHYLTRVERRVSKIYEVAKKAKQKKKSKEIERRQSLKDKLRTMNIDVDVNELENVAPCRDDMLEFGICKIDRLFLKSDGSMRFKDQHVDIVSRYLYPIIYLLVYIVFHVRWTHKANQQSLNVNF